MERYPVAPLSVRIGTEEMEFEMDQDNTKPLIDTRTLLVLAIAAGIGVLVGIAQGAGAGLAAGLAAALALHVLIAT